MLFAHNVRTVRRRGDSRIARHRRICLHKLITTELYYISHTPIRFDEFLKFRAMRHKGGESPLQHTNIICSNQKIKAFSRRFSECDGYVCANKYRGCEAISPHRRGGKRRWCLAIVFCIALCFVCTCPKSGTPKANAPTGRWRSGGIDKLKFR